MDSSFEAHFGPLSEAGASYLWSSITASLALGALIGCFLSVPMGDYFGLTKALMICNNVILFIGCLFFGIAKVRVHSWTTENGSRQSVCIEPANSWECLVLGKIFLGIYSGVAMSLQTALIQEASPPQFRGPLSCVVHITMTVGSTLGALLGTDAVLGTRERWPFLLAFPAVFGLPQLFLLRSFKDSPKYLHYKRPHSDQALESIFFYYGPDVDSRKVLADFDAELAAAPESLSIWDCLAIPEYRGRMLLSALVNFVQIFTGLMAIVSYSTIVLTQLGLSAALAEWGTAVGALFGLLSSFPVIFLIDREGRRGMLLWSLAVLSLTLFSFVGFGVMLERGVGGMAPQILFLLACFVFLVGYNFGPGPIAYFIAGELAPAPCRTSFLALGVCVNWISTMISTFAFYPLDQAFGSESFLLFAIPTTLSTLLLYAFLPETRPRLPSDSPSEKSPLLLPSGPPSPTAPLSQLRT